MREKLGRLYTAMSDLGNLKILQDKFESLMYHSKIESNELIHEM